MAAPACHKNEGVTPHHGTCKHSFQYKQFVVWAWTWNLGSQTGNGGDVCEELRTWVIGVCWLLVRSRGQPARMLGIKGRRCKLSWPVEGDEFGCVVIMGNNGNYWVGGDV